jgi:hypothetical protein
MPLAERVTERIETLDGARGRADTQHRHPYETPELYEQIQAHCAACGKDVSAVSREIWQKEISTSGIRPEQGDVAAVRLHIRGAATVGRPLQG